VLGPNLLKRVGGVGVVADGALDAGAVDLRRHRLIDADQPDWLAGFGAAKNLSDFAINAAQCQVQPDVLALAKAFAEAGKPGG
ncbi:hypothetical protein ACV34T_32790, partial [Pseudomonas aeruginosa]